LKALPVLQIRLAVETALCSQKWMNPVRAVGDVSPFIAIEATRVLNIANQPHQEIPVKRVEQLM
jgi:hypothetical protein